MGNTAVIVAAVQHQHKDCATLSRLVSSSAARPSPAEFPKSASSRKVTRIAGKPSPNGQFESETQARRLQVNDAGKCRPMNSATQSPKPSLISTNPT